MSNQIVLKWLPFAQAVYGAKGDAAAKPLPVGNFVPVGELPGFKPTAGASINPALYVNKLTGEYVIAYAGTVDGSDAVADAQSLWALQDQRTATTAFLASWHPQLTDAINLALCALLRDGSSPYRQSQERRGLARRLS